MIKTPTEMLFACRAQFQSYGDQHMAKDPPQVEKAATNYAFVNDINLTLLEAASVRTPDSMLDAGT